MCYLRTPRSRSPGMAFSLRHFSHHHGLVIYTDNSDSNMQTRMFHLLPPHQLPLCLPFPRWYPHLFSHTRHLASSLVLPFSLSATKSCQFYNLNSSRIYPFPTISNFGSALHFPPADRDSFLSSLLSSSQVSSTHSLPSQACDLCQMQIWSHP